MSSSPSAATAAPPRTDNGVLARIFHEGHGAGTGAWHGRDLAAAIADVASETAFQRPARGRHSIAEVALHHAWYLRSVNAQLTGLAAVAFPLEGEDWFELNAGAGPSWEEVRTILAGYQEALKATVAGIESGRIASPLAEAERLSLVLGITCHAVYHAGQVQLVKRLLGG